MLKIIHLSVHHNNMQNISTKLTENAFSSQQMLSATKLILIHHNAIGTELMKIMKIKKKNIIMAEIIAFMSSKCKQRKCRLIIF